MSRSLYTVHGQGAYKLIRTMVGVVPIVQAAVHHPWCVDHTGNGCLGATVQLARNVFTWLAAPAGLPTRLVVDTPSGVHEVEVDDREESVPVPRLEVVQPSRPRHPSD